MEIGYGNGYVNIEIFGYADVHDRASQTFCTVKRVRLALSAQFVKM